MKLTIILSLITLLFISSCSVEPAPIQYGDDHCSFCDMTVVDKTHAAEYTTKKGKSYVFDAIECMVNQLNKKHNEDKMAFILVADYSHPGTLIDAKTATFLISPEIKSPMGANLSAFPNENTAKEYQTKYSGDLYNWEQLKDKFKK